MAGVGVEEIRTVKVTTTDGKAINPGDVLYLSIRGQDIICKFAEVDGSGYFVTVPVISGGGTKTIRYRLQSIANCFKVKNFEVEATEQTLKEAAQTAADHADQEALAPATE